MDNRLVLTVLFVTLSWMSVGTYAQDNATTAAPSSDSTKPMATNMTHMPMVTNMTHMPMATNMTHMPMATNMTTAPPNNMTHMPMATHMTTAAPTTNATTAPPLTANLTVVPLQQNITNQGCGTEQLCASEPSSCNPAVPGSCFFLAAKLQSGRNFEFGLSGESEGYIAASLSTDDTLGDNDATYVCANNNGVVKFFSTVLNNGQLIPTNLSVNNVKGQVTGRRIQCTFAATLPSLRTRAESFTVGISSGPFNSSSGTLGAPSTQLRSPAVNLANPNATVTNVVNATTTASPNTTVTTMNATIAPPLTANLTVVPLQQNITNQGCGTEQLCASEPSSCNPAVPGSCFFLAAKLQSGRNFEFGLSGESEGYIAASLSPDDTLGGNDTTYVCANNNGVVKFFSTVLNNGRLIPANLSVNNVKGQVTGRRIQCTFAATLPSTTLRVENFAIGISSGPFNSSSGALGEPTIQFRSSVVDLANPNATVTNVVNATTTASPNTTVTATPSGHAIALQQSLTQALLITVGVLSMAML